MMLADELDVEELLELAALDELDAAEELLELELELELELDTALEELEELAGGGDELPPPHAARAIMQNVVVRAFVDSVFISLFPVWS